MTTLMVPLYLIGYFRGLFTTITSGGSRGGDVYFLFFCLLVSRPI